MGYESTVTVDNFYTKYSVEECEQLRKQILETKSPLFPKRDMIEEVIFKEHTSLVPTFNCIYCDFSEHTRRWDYESDYSLAILISLLMDDTFDQYVDLTMRGEDDERWGYRIRHRKIIPLVPIWEENKKNEVILTNEFIVEALI